MRSRVVCSSDLVSQFGFRPFFLSRILQHQMPRMAFSQSPSIKFWHFGIAFGALGHLRGVKMDVCGPREGSVLDIQSPEGDFGADWHSNDTPKGPHFGTFLVQNL